MRLSDTNAILLLKAKLGIDDNLDRAVSELFIDYEAKCQALAKKEKQEQQFHNFMEALAVKLRKANALTIGRGLGRSGYSASFNYHPQKQIARSRIATSY